MSDVPEFSTTTDGLVSSIENYVVNVGPETQSAHAVNGKQYKEILTPTAPDKEKAIEIAWYIFLYVFMDVFFAKGPNIIYWRIKPEIHDSDDGYRIYMRLLVDKRSSINQGFAT